MLLLSNLLSGQQSISTKRNKSIILQYCKKEEKYYNLTENSIVHTIDPFCTYLRTSEKPNGTLMRSTLSKSDRNSIPMLVHVSSLTYALRRLVRQLPLADLERFRLLPSISPEFFFWLTKEKLLIFQLPSGTICSAPFCWTTV